MTGSDVQVLPEAGRPDTQKQLALAGGLTLDEVKSIGTVFFQSGLFKDTRSAAAAITKVLAGQEMGVPPMEAMRGFHVYEGNVHFSAGLVGALIKRSRQYDYRVKEANDSVCVIEWRERVNTGLPIAPKYEVVGESSFTRAEAEAANLLRKANWQTYAEDMLFARALTRGARRYCPDVFGGAVYVPGEDAPEQEDRPEPFVQPTPKVNLAARVHAYDPPRTARLHEDSPPAEDATPAADATSESSPSSTSETDQPEGEPLFSPSPEEVEALEADQHRDPHA